MLIKKIFSEIKYNLIFGDLNIEANNIVTDSRQVNKNSIFFCISGLKNDGHNFINNAIDNGAECVVIDKNICFRKYGNLKAIIKVNSVREILSFCAANFFGRPSDDLNLIGITGTNGKTSTAYFVNKILMSQKEKTGLIGTLGTKIRDKKINFYYSTPTTPDAIELQKILFMMKNENVKNVIMEVSSHALALNKTDCIKFKIGAFTNISQDHLDFHADMKNYLDSKNLLFKNSEIGILNLDDNSSEYIISNNSCEFLTFSINKSSDFKAENINLKNDSVNFDVKINNELESFYLPIPGNFSIYNALCAIVISYTMGVDINLIREKLKNIDGVPGRIQKVPSEKYNIIIDYAHSPDSLENILKTAREFTEKKLICVFGCGGDRDQLKRPMMGKIASKYCDYCILTSDNPRTEDPEKIINDIKFGFDKKKFNYETEIDRHKAIEKAINNLSDNKDTLVISGKGHENYQIFADRTIHFDDFEVVEKILSSL
ncbi:MAG: UDP-N-acetylmuramoyl-L-alanyl-D-glutamate--2,6-diaminopimelate ligase [Clostridiales bacterium]|nr:UDP-N-acetylmuramoyl-L-alanyl-D-glutamate--2,6-diaminopimelate ligase [Clostridiales bacterium]